MSLSAPPCVILTRRRTGAADLYRLLGNYLPWERKGNEPFLWSRSMGDVSKRFHAGELDAAKQLLSAELSKGITFKHQFETESWGFNTFLLQALEACGYRVIRVEREREDERLFSLLVASHFSTWAREGIEGVRERLRKREPAPDIAAARVSALVRDEAGYRRWIDAELPRYRLDCLTVTYEAFFRNGVKALSLADEIFAFAGLGSRASILDDASLLRFIFSGEHHTLGLIDYSENLFQVHQQIVAELGAAAKLPR